MILCCSAIAIPVNCLKANICRYFDAFGDIVSIPRVRIRTVKAKAIPSSLNDIDFLVIPRKVKPSHFLQCHVLAEFLENKKTPAERNSHSSPLFLSCKMLACRKSLTPPDTYSGKVVQQLISGLWIAFRSLPAFNRNSIPLRSLVLLLGGHV